MAEPGLLDTQPPAVPYSEFQFFPKLCAFNIGWHEKPKRLISSYIDPKGTLLRGEPPKPEFASHYEGFPVIIQANVLGLGK